MECSKARWVRPLLGLLLGVLVVPVNAAVGNGPGHAVDWATWIQGSRIESRRWPGLCAEISASSTASGTPVSQWPCGSTGGRNQRWQTVVNARYLQMFLRNEHSRLCLQHESIPRQRSCTVDSGRYEQIWTMLPTSGGYYRLRSTLTGNCLASGATVAHGAGLRIAPCVGTATEWRSRDGVIAAPAGYLNRRTNITPVTTPDHHFWAAPFSLVTHALGGNPLLGGYIGLQRGAVTDNGQQFPRAAVFSIWGAGAYRSVAAGGAASSWEGGGEGGYGISCVVPYAWRDAYSYALDMSYVGAGTGPTDPRSGDQVAGKWWAGKVGGMTICQIFVPNRDRAGSLVYYLSGRSSSFSENFSSGYAQCKPPGSFRARFAPPYVWGRGSYVDSDPVYRNGSDPNCYSLQVWQWEPDRNSYGTVFIYRGAR